MLRKSIAWLFIGLLLFASVDDLLAAETDNTDDDFAASADNDCIANEAAGAQLRAALFNLIVCWPSPIAGTPITPLAYWRFLPALSSPRPHHRDLLYSLMSLQR
jgi:hypothetical protein